VAAGAIEGLISPRTDLPFAFKLAVALISAVLIGWYVMLGRLADANATAPRAP
jgi:hypothetical protein